MVGVATDLISYLLSGQAYPLNFIVTIGAGLIGVVSGLCFRLRFKKQALRIAFSTAIAHLAGSVIVKTIGLYQFYGILVLWRIPLYFVIATIETLLLCALFRRKSIQKLINDI